MVNVMVSGVKGSKTERQGFRGVGYKILAPYSGLAEKSRVARADLLDHVHASQGHEENPLLFTVSPPEKITSMDDIHTLYVLVDEKSFGNDPIPEDLVRFDMPTQQCLHFHYEGSMNNCTNFYFELFAQIRKGDIDYDTSGYRLEEYGRNHNWDDKETTANELDIFFPIK